MSNFKKIFSLLLRVSVSVILLALLFKITGINIPDLINDIRRINKLFLGIGFAVFFLMYFLGYLRWQMLLEGAGIKSSLKKTVSSYSGGIFFSIFLPSTIGGDVIRSADLAGHTRKAKEVIATVFLDRLSGYIGLAFVVLPAILLGRELVSDRIVFASVGVIMALLVFILLVLFNTFIYSGITRFLNTPGAEKIKEMIKDMHREIHVFRHRKKLIVYNLLLSFFIQLAIPVSTYFIALSLGVKISFVYFLIFIPIIGAITLLPIAIGGLGLRESLFVVYFAKAGVIKQLALAMSLLSFSFIVVYGAIGGLIYVLTVHHRRLQHDKPPGV